MKPNNPVTPEIALKPCSVPWCGDNNAEVVDVSWGHFRAVRCTRCYTTGPWSQTDDEAIAAWNTRLAMVEQGPDVEAWQPIKTAPKDVPVLVWGEAIRWRGMGGVTPGYVLSDYNGHKDIVSLDGIAGPKFRQVEVTHWRPLPDPPRAALGDG